MPKFEYSIENLESVFKCVLEIYYGSDRQLSPTVECKCEIYARIPTN